MGLYADELLHGTPAGRSIEDGAPPARCAPSTTTRRSVRIPLSLANQPNRTHATFRLGDTDR